jgi:transposase
MDKTLLPGSDVEDAHTTGHRSARNAPIEVVTRGERRRAWTPDQKREIVVESLGPALTPTEVARKHGIGTGLLYTWRQQVLGEQMGLLTRSPPSFAQVEAAPEQPRLPAPDPAPEPLGVPAPVPAAAATARLDGLAEGLIEIVLPGGVSVRVDAQVDARALRRVLGALEGR